MYDASDLQSTLRSTTVAPIKAPTVAYSGAKVIEFHKVTPNETEERRKTCYGRSQNFVVSYTEVVVSYTEVEAGALLTRHDGVAVNCPSPSMTMIPQPAIHTTQALPEPPCLLYDMFSPPRVEFSLKPGWALNETDYPMPDAVQ